jgi:D-galactose 1-dehydrogenase
MGRIPIAIVGLGKIARDQHLPAIAGNPDFELAAIVSRNASLDGVPHFHDVESFLRDGPKAALSVCTPPEARLDACLGAIEAGRDLMIEKPPAATIGEIETIAEAARRAGVTLFATWHSRFAPGVEMARRWISERRVERIDIVWREDVRRWHPGQAWIWEPGGFGVFDPGINALSILTAIAGPEVHVSAAELDVPANAATAIGARLSMRVGKVPIEADFDWRQEGPQTWDILVKAEGGSMKLGDGGASLSIDGNPVALEPEAEYPTIYRRFHDLVTSRQSDVDIAPLRIVADALLMGRQRIVEAFRDG